jgi:ATP-dependent Clp protease adapter protein ClpS
MTYPNVVLQEVFSKDGSEAKKMMMAVHCGEIVSFGPFTREEGQMRAEKVIRIARAAGEPYCFRLRQLLPNL